MFKTENKFAWLGRLALGLAAAASTAGAAHAGEDADYSADTVAAAQAASPRFVSEQPVQVGDDPAYPRLVAEQPGPSAARLEPQEPESGLDA